MSFAPPHTACVACATGVTTGRSRHPPREIAFKEHLTQCPSVSPLSVTHATTRHRTDRAAGTGPLTLDVVVSDHTRTQPTIPTSHGVTLPQFVRSSLAKQRLHTSRQVESPPAVPTRLQAILRPPVDEKLDS